MSTTLHKRIKNVINKAFNLTYITDMNKNKLIPQVKHDTEEHNNKLLKFIVRDQLKFKYQYEEFGPYDNLQLLQYIMKKGDNWTLNSSSLEEIYKYFKGKYSKEFLRRKAFKYGVEYLS